MLAVAAAAIEYASAYQVEADMQRALDAAVVAGVKADAGEELATAELTYLNSIHSKSDSTPSFSLGQDGNIAGSARTTIDAGMARLLRMGPIRVSVTSEARLVRTTKPTPGGSGLCMVLLGRDADNALQITRGTQLSAPRCQIDVAGTASPAAIFEAGTQVIASRVCVTGSSVAERGGRHTGVSTDWQASADPFAGKLPEPGDLPCTHTHGTFAGGYVVLQPGVYCGMFTFKADTDVEFRHGLYVIKGGGWTVNKGHWFGEGVTFHFADTSSIKFNASISTDLTAPKDGAHAGILFYEAEGLPHSRFPCDDRMGSKFNGLWHLPSRDVIMHSGAKPDGGWRSVMVFNSLVLDDARVIMQPHEMPQYGVMNSSTMTESAVVLSK